ncbi:hypothetical protein F8M41_008724 [Gigaspora margarita]|uniref:Uncharacterized protein n=1 Tax=Gigaspora margarita TaxID=4874 RepID=A0A8H4AVM1_GIGMA|nr:hypothetical protein F8M41_008724 [Gigaspora margarita]
MVQYDTTLQYLLPTSENFITIDPILSSTPNNTYVHMQHFDPQPVDKISIFFMQGFDYGSVENFHTNGIMEMVVEIMEPVFY